MGKIGDFFSGLGGLFDSFASIKQANERAIQAINAREVDKLDTAIRDVQNQLSQAMKLGDYDAVKKLTMRYDALVGADIDSSLRRAPIVSAMPLTRMGQEDVERYAGMSPTFGTRLALNAQDILAYEEALRTKAEKDYMQEQLMPTWERTISKAEANRLKAETQAKKQTLTYKQQKELSDTGKSLLVNNILKTDNTTILDEKSSDESIMEWYKSQTNEIRQKVLDDTFQSIKAEDEARKSQSKKGVLGLVSENQPKVLEEMVNYNRQKKQEDVEKLKIENDNSNIQYLKNIYATGNRKNITYQLKRIREDLKQDRINKELYLKYYKILVGA
jgi:hypothetical protein